MHNEALYREIVGTDHRESLVVLVAAVVLSVVAGRAFPVDPFRASAVVATTVGAPLAFAVAYRNGAVLVTVAVVVASASVAESGVFALVTLPLTLLLGPFIAPGPGFASVGLVVYVVARTVAHRRGKDSIGPIERALRHRNVRVAVAGGVAGLAVGLGRAVTPVGEGVTQWELTVVLLALGLGVYVRGGGYLGVVGVGVGNGVPFVADARAFPNVFHVWLTLGETGWIALFVVAVGLAGRRALDRIPTGDGRPVTLDDVRTALVWAAPWLVLATVGTVDPSVAGSARLAVAYVACVLVVLGVATGSMVVAASGWHPASENGDRRPQRLAGGVTGVALVVVSAAVL